MIQLGKSWGEMTKDELVSEISEIFDEREFWKSLALENKEVSEDAYKIMCEEVQEMFFEMDPDNTGYFHG
jgi:hypothetical protein|tara:strand:- start:375 stop:584 length:210 start_codon:yes stop_codon:yes gene_type:complete